MRTGITPPPKHQNPIYRRRLRLESVQNATDHNAGAMVRGVIAIRIDPMPAGVEEFDYMNGGWAYINANQLIIYGYNVH